MQAHSTGCGAVKEVNKQRLIRLHQGPSYHPGNLVIPNTHMDPLKVSRCESVNKGITDVCKLEATLLPLDNKLNKPFGVTTCVIHGRTGLCFLHLFTVSTFINMRQIFQTK